MISCLKTNSRSYIEESQNARNSYNNQSNSQTKDLLENMKETLNDYINKIDSLEKNKSFLELDSLIKKNEGDKQSHLSEIDQIGGKVIKNIEAIRHPVINELKNRTPEEKNNNSELEQNVEIAKNIILSAVHKNDRNDPNSIEYKVSLKSQNDKELLDKVIEKLKNEDFSHLKKILSFKLYEELKKNGDKNVEQLINSKENEFKAKFRYTLNRVKDISEEKLKESRNLFDEMLNRKKEAINQIILESKNELNSLYDQITQNDPENAQNLKDIIESNKKYIRDEFDTMVKNSIATYQKLKEAEGLFIEKARSQWNDIKNRAIEADKKINPDKYKGVASEASYQNDDEYLSNEEKKKLDFVVNYFFNKLEDKKNEKAEKFLDREINKNLIGEKINIENKNNSGAFDSFLNKLTEIKDKLYSELLNKNPSFIEISDNKDSTKVEQRKEFNEKFVNGNLEDIAVVKDHKVSVAISELIKYEMINMFVKDRKDNFVYHNNTESKLKRKIPLDQLQFDDFIETKEFQDWKASFVKQYDLMPFRLVNQIERLFPQIKQMYSELIQTWKETQSSYS